MKTNFRIKSILIISMIAFAVSAAMPRRAAADGGVIALCAVVGSGFGLLAMSGSNLGWLDGLMNFKTNRAIKKSVEGKNCKDMSENEVGRARGDVQVGQNSSSSAATAQYKAAALDVRGENFGNKNGSDAAASAKAAM